MKATHCVCLAEAGGDVLRFPGCQVPLMIGGATTSKRHTVGAPRVDSDLRRQLGTQHDQRSKAVKITTKYDHGVIHVGTSGHSPAVHQ